MNTPLTAKTAALAKKIAFYFFFGLSVAMILYVSSQTLTYRPTLKIQNTIDDSHFIRRFMIRGTDATLTEDIVIVDIDDRCLDELGNFKLWSRHHFTNVIGNLNRDGARLIFLDTLLKEGGSARVNRALADSIKSAGNVVSGYYFNLDRSINLVPQDPVYNDRFSSNWLKSQSIEKNEFLQAQDIILSYHDLIMATHSVGCANYIPDPDGIVRNIPLFIQYGRMPFPTASLQMWLYLNGMNYTEGTITPSGVRYGDMFVPTDKHCFMRLNYYASKPVFEYVSFVDVLNGQFVPGTFAGKIVMIGSSAEELGDLLKIPGYNALPGVELHATALSNMLHNNILTTTSGNTVFIITLVSGVLASIIFSFVPPFRIGLPIAVSVPLILFVYSIYSFIAHLKLINFTLPACTVLMLYFVIVIHRLVDRYEKTPEG